MDEDLRTIIDALNFAPGETRSVTLAAATDSDDAPAYIVTRTDDGRQGEAGATYEVELDTTPLPPA